MCPHGPLFSQFHEVFRKFGQKNRFGTSSCGESWIRPRLFSRFIKYNDKAEVDLIKWISMGDIYPNFLSSQIIDTFW